MSVFGGNVDISVATDDGEYDEHVDRERINAAVANEMSDLSSDDDDFEPSQFHRNLRDPNRVPVPNFTSYEKQNETESFSSFDKNASPLIYQSKIPKPMYSPSQGSPRNDGYGELNEVKSLYSAAQRRIQELERHITNNTAEYQDKIKTLSHEKQIDFHRAQEMEEQLLTLRAELEKSESIVYELNKKVQSFQLETTNYRSQNEEYEKRIVTQEAVIQSLENELRVAHSDDALTKANYTHQRRIDEMRRQHDDTVRGLNTDSTQLQRAIDSGNNERETIKGQMRELERTLNRERIENGETINRLNTLLRDAQQHPIPADSIAKKIDFEPSECTFDASTPRDMIDSAELNVTRTKYHQLRKELDIKSNNLRVTQNELQGALEENENMTHEKDELTQQLRTTRDELQSIHSDFEQFKQNTDDERQNIINQKEEMIQQHYQRTVSMKLDQAKEQNDATCAAIRSELENEILKRISEIDDLNRTVDSIKEDYCELAVEKENLENQLQLRKGTTEMSETIAELNEAKEHYATAQRRIHDLELQLKNITTEFQEQIKSVAHNAQSNSSSENVKLKGTIDELNKQVEDLRDKNIVPCQTSNDNDSSTRNAGVTNNIDQLKKKFSAEREQWAKERRRLDSKIRHLTKQIGRCSSPTSSVGSGFTTPRDEISVSSADHKLLQTQLATAKIKYNETLRKIKAEVATTIDEMKTKNNERIKREVLIEQKRTSEKLREYYKNILAKLLVADHSDNSRLDKLDMRVVYSCLSCVSMYLVSSSVKWSVISAVVTYLLHFPLPLNVDNFFAMYLTMKGLSVGELLGQIKLGLGFVSELDMRRAGVDNIRPKVVRGVSVQVKKMENYDLHIFTPDIIKSKGAVVFYHGGGFVVLHVYSYQKYLSSMAKELGCIVFSPEYRLAPEHPWPIGDGDCHHATEHVFSHAEMYNVDRYRIAMTGDSAGGFLTFVTWYRMREYFKKHNVQPALLSLVYPALGYRFDSPSYQRNGSMPFLSVDDVLFYYLAHGGWMEKGVPSPVKHNILKHSIHVDESKVSPSFLRNLDPERWLDEDELRDWVKPKTVTKVFTPEEAKFRLDVTKVIQDVTFVPLNVSDDELADFPSVVTYVCEHDVLKNDGQMLHNRLKHIGKESKLVVMEGAFHAQMIFAQQFLGLKAFKRTTKAFDEYVATIGTYIQ